MKHHAMELPSKKKTPLRNIPKMVFMLVLIAIPLYSMRNDFAPLSPLLSSSTSLQQPSSPSSYNFNNSMMITRLDSTCNLSLPSSSPNIVDTSRTTTRLDKNCNIFYGKWVPSTDVPYYTNTTCRAISDRQNCMKYGRPDTDFLKWRWKPNGCDLPMFDAAEFMELVRGKSMAFVGDSLARNHMQSLICLLSDVENPTDVSNTSDDRFKRWQYNNHNFTLASFWSPYLVPAKEAVPTRNRPTYLMNLYLDKFDEKWTAKIDRFDYVIISAEHWFFRPLMFYEGGHIVGCNACKLNNVPELTMYYGYQKALKTAFRAINKRNFSKATVVLRTISPAHYDNGRWDEGATCNRTRPLTGKDMRLEGSYKEMYVTQMKEFRAARKGGRNRGLKYRLLNITESMLMRPDGHPNQYGHVPHERRANDCSHWCLPGPIDAWNDLLLQILKMDGRG